MVLWQLKSYPNLRYVIRKHVSVILKILNVILHSDRISFQTLEVSVMRPLGQIIL